MSVCADAAVAKIIEASTASLTTRAVHDDSAVSMEELADCPKTLPDRASMPNATVSSVSIHIL